MSTIIFFPHSCYKNMIVQDTDARICHNNIKTISRLKVHMLQNNEKNPKPRALLYKQIQMNAPIQKLKGTKGIFTTYYEGFVNSCL